MNLHLISLNIKALYLLFYLQNKEKLFDLAWKDKN